MMPTRPRTPVQLDARDLRILDNIQRNGRISKKALAEEIGVTMTPCFQRLQRLEKEGFIRGYRGVVETRRFGPFVWVYTHVTLARHRTADFERFEAAVNGIPEVIECDVVSGGVDYVLKFIVRDVSHYLRLIEELLARDIGMSVYVSYIVTKRIKESASIPLAALTRHAS
jgi:Lrp/AsnC family transcriptional regulator, regulator of ectoine-degradation genes